MTPNLLREECRASVGGLMPLNLGRAIAFFGGRFDLRLLQTDGDGLAARSRLPAQSLNSPRPCHDLFPIAHRDQRAADRVISMMWPLCVPIPAAACSRTPKMRAARRIRRRFVPISCSGDKDHGGCAV